MKERILVHICCAPDLLYFLKRLKEDNPDKEIIGFFYDPNIHPKEEYDLRLTETKRICKLLGIELIEGEYDVENWLEAIKGLEEEPERGKRCQVCFDIRLKRSFEKAKELNCQYVTTTLLMSPKKDINQLKFSGENLESEYDIKFIAPDYRKGGGTQEMFRLAKDYEIYMQDYCGCIYGMINQGKDMVVYTSRIKGRRPGSREEFLFIKRIKFLAESRELTTKEIPFPFLGWILLSGSLHVNDEPVESVIEPYSMSIKGIVKGKVERKTGNVLHLNRGFVRIKLKEKVVEDIPVTFNGLINPTFVVHSSLERKLMEGKIKATLQSRFEEMKSIVLIIGSENAEYLIGVPADTPSTGEGVKLEEVDDLIKLYHEDIYKGRLAIVVLGAEINGKFGSKVFESTTGRKIDGTIKSLVNG